MELKDRLKLARKNAKKSQKEVAEQVDITQPTLSQLESGLITSSTYLPAIARLLGVELYWLQTGKGEMSVGEANNNEYSNARILNNKSYKIPVLDFAQAGIFNSDAYSEVTPKTETYTSYQGKNPRKVFNLTVEGLSMFPDFVPGDELTVDAALTPKPGYLVIAKIRDFETVFRKYRVTNYDEYGQDVFELVPVNSNFPILSSKERVIEIIGVVVQNLHKLKYE